MSPTERTLKTLRADGFLAAVVERWIPRANVRKDLFGFGDILAFHPARQEIVIVQSCTATNRAARLAKAKARPELVQWLKAGGLFEVYSWKLHKPGWTCKRIAVRGEGLEELEVEHIVSNFSRSPRKKKASPAAGQAAAPETVKHEPPEKQGPFFREKPPLEDPGPASTVT